MGVYGAGNGHHETGQSGLRFLPDERVDFGDVDVVQLLDRVFNLVLVRLHVDDEHKRVVVLDLLHRGLCRQGELNDGIMIQPAGKNMYTWGH